MSNKSKKLNKEFDAKLLAKAKKIAEKYEIIIALEDGEYYGRGLEMPFVFGEGKNADECIQNTREAFASTIAHLLERGEIVPAPAKEGKRTEQVNIRLTVEEKAILGSTARAQGFQGLADFIRSRALTAQP